MSISVTVNGNPVNVNRGKITNSEIGGVKTKELQRRRKLRLLQVREQSNVIAKKIRERVSNEHLNILSDLDKTKKKAFASEQDQIVQELKQRCQSNAENFGVGHASAAEEIAISEAHHPGPDKSSERGNSAKAQVQSTRKQGLEDQKRQLERKLLARNIANERSRQNFASNFREKTQQQISETDIENEEDEISNTNLDVTINSGADGSISIHRRISHPANKQSSQTRTPSVTIYDDTGPLTSKAFTETLKKDIETSRGFSHTSKRDIEIQCDVEFTNPDEPLQTSSKISLTNHQSNQVDASKRKELKTNQKSLFSKSTEICSKNSESKEVGSFKNNGESTQKNDLLPIIEETKSADDLSSKSLKSKSSLSIVSRFIQDRDKRIPENRPGFHKVRDSDMEKIRETLIRTRTSEISSNPKCESDKSCKVYDTDSIPGPSWEPSRNTNFITYNNHMNKVLLRPTSSGRISTKYGEVGKKKVERPQSSKSKPCLVSKPISPTKCGGKTKKSLTSSKKTPTASVKSSRPISASSKTTISERRSKTAFVTQYDHVTRSIRDIPTDQNSPLVTKVLQKDRPSEDAFEAALKETLEVADVERSNLQSGIVKPNSETDRSNLGLRRLEDMERRGEEAVQVEKVGKEYKDLMKRLKQISKDHAGAGKIIESAFMDDTRQNVRRSDHQRRMEEEFERIQHDSAALSTYPDEAQQHKKSSKIQKQPIVDDVDTENLQNCNQIEISDKCTLSHNKTVVIKCSKCKNFKKHDKKIFNSDSNGRCTQCNCIITDQKPDKLPQKDVITFLAPKSSEQACKKKIGSIKNCDKCTNNVGSGDKCITCGNYFKGSMENNEKSHQISCHMNENQRNYINISHDLDTCGNPCLDYAHQDTNQKVPKKCCHTNKIVEREMESNAQGGISSTASGNNGPRTSPRFSKKDVEDIMRESLKFLRAEGVMELNVGDKEKKEKDVEKMENVAEVGRGDNCKVPLRKETMRNKMKQPKNISLSRAAADSQSEASVHSEMDTDAELWRLVQEVERNQKILKKRMPDRRKLMDWDTGAVRRPQKKSPKKKIRPVLIPSETTECTEDFKTAIGPSSTIVPSTKCTEIPLKNNESPSKIILKTTKSASDHEFEIHIEFRKRVESILANVDGNQKLVYAEDEVSKCSISSASTAYMKLPDKILPNGYRSNFFKCYNAHVTEVDAEKTLSDVSDLMYWNESEWESTNVESPDRNCFGYCECGIQCEFCAKSCRKLKKDKLKKGLHVEICECEKDFLAFAQYQRYVGSNKLDLETFQEFLSELKRRESNRKKKQKHLSKRNLHRSEQGKEDGENRRLSFLNDIFRNKIDVNGESYARSSGTSTSALGSQVGDSGSEIGALTSSRINSGTGTVRTVDIGVQGSPISDLKYLEENHNKFTNNVGISKDEFPDSDKIPTKDTDSLIARKKKVCSKAHPKSQTKNARKKLGTKKYEQENEMERIVQGNRFPYNFNTDTVDSKSKELDPQVQAYIKKLLTISRDKIALMEVSSSSVATPSSSIIETPANSMVNMFQEDPEKLARLNKFFKENQDLVTGLLSISEDSVLLSKYDVETQIMHSNVPILKFKSKFKPASDVNAKMSSQSFTRKDRKKLKPSVLARSRSRNLTKHFEHRQVVEQKKLIRVLNSLGSVRRDLNSANKKIKTTKPANSYTVRSSSVSEKQSPKTFMRPKTAPNVPIATVKATSKKVIDDKKATKEIVGLLSPQKLKTKIRTCNVEPISENKSKKKSPRLSIETEKTQAVYERSVQEGRSFFPKDSKDSIQIIDNRLSTKMKSNSCNNVKIRGKSPKKTSPRHIQCSSPPVKDTNSVKLMVENSSGDKNTKIIKKRPVKVCSKDFSTVLKSTVSAPTKKSLLRRRDGIEEVIKTTYSNKKKRDASLSLHTESETCEQQKNNVVKCKPMNIENYADLTEKCTQRLSDINRVIEVVRKNKSNIYSHLSSGDSSRSESAKSERTSSFSIDLVKDDIQVPKPTARDINEITEKSHLNTNGESIKHQNLVVTAKPSSPKRSSPKQEDFVPILSDIPKPNRLDSASNCIPANIFAPKPLGSSFVGKSTGKSRPPPAFSRVMLKINPLEHIEAHELSTVVEVDSPLSVRNSSINRTRNAFNKSPTIFDTPKSVTGTKIKDHPAKLFKTTPNSKEETDSSKIVSEVKISPLVGNSGTPSKRTDISLEKNSKDISNNEKKNGDFLKPDSKSLARGQKNPFEEMIEDDTKNTTPNSLKVKKNIQTDKIKMASESIPLSSHKNDDQDKENKFPMIEVETFKELMLKPFLTFEEYAKKLNLTVTEASLSDTTPSNNSKEKDSNNSEGTLPDIVAELLKRNVISEPFRIDGIPYASNIDSFDGKPNANSTTISPASSVSELAEKSTYRGKPEKILTKFKCRATETRNIDANAPQQAEKSSTADLEGALQDLGMGWMLYTLRKTQESLALSSSSSSSKYGSTQPKMTSAQKLREAKKLLTQLPPSSLGSSTDIQSILANILPDTSSMESFERDIRTDKDKNKDITQKTMDQKNNVTQTVQQTSGYLDFGNDSNAIKKFIEKELANKITFSKESVSQNSDNEHYTSLYSTRNETTHFGDAEKCDNSDVHSKSSSKARSHTRRTSTPVQLYKAQGYNNSSSSSLINNSTALFSNVDDMSSVRASRCSVKNDSSSDKDGLSVPSVSLRLKSSKDRRNSKDSSSDGSNVVQRK